MKSFTVLVATFTTAPPLLAHIKAAKMRALAVTGGAALPSLPAVPTISKIKGFEKLDASSWFVVYARPALPSR